MKPIVSYKRSLHPICIGQVALIVGRGEHPLLGKPISEDQITRTSTVVEVNDGGFETLNTQYVRSSES